MNFSAETILLTIIAWIGMTVPVAAQSPTITGEHLLGEVTQEEVSTYVAAKWGNHKSPDGEKWRQAVAELAEAVGNTKLEVFFGTWCHDSEREVPRLLDVLAELERTHRELALDVRWVAVDGEKRLPVEEVQTHRIRQLPTLVLSRQGTELGRIVQRAPRGLETDLRRLLDGSAQGLVSASETAIRNYLRPPIEPDMEAPEEFDTSSGMAPPDSPAILAANSASRRLPRR